MFPRFHQWDAGDEARGRQPHNGPGQSYLVQHSAGSGKSNSIGWLAPPSLAPPRHRPTRRSSTRSSWSPTEVLDQQLQGTVQQFESVRGTIVSVEGKDPGKSTELAEALTGTAQIITVTLETFPFVIDKICQDAALGPSNYAIIVDEAHSSQTGDAANALKQALGAGRASGDRPTEGGGTRAAEDGDADAEEALAAIVAARGHQQNLSFFAFTATPKDRTLELFGTPDADGRSEPFHLYSMRQAIEEGFILDVLANYTTYADLLQDREGDVEEAAAEEVDVQKAASAIAPVRDPEPALI